MYEPLSELFAGAAGYAMTLLVQMVRFVHCPARMRAFDLMRKVFRLLCTALYITGIMIDVCSLDSVQQTGPLVAWYDVQLVWAALWGTNCLWPGNTIRQRLSAHGTAPQRKSLP